VQSVGVGFEGFAVDVVSVGGGAAHVALNKAE
jgi:hypothetical protein